MSEQKAHQPPYPPPYPYPYPPLEEETSLLDYWKTLMKWKFLVIGFTLLAVIGSVIVALTATPVYRAEVLLAPIEEESGGRLSDLMSRYGGLASMAGIQVGGREGINKKDESLAILKSRIFLSTFIRDENLLPVLYADAWDREKGDWKTEAGGAPTKGQAYEYFSEMVGVSTDRETGLVTVTVDYGDPDLAARWANRLIRKLNVYVKQRQLGEAEKNLAFLRKQLGSTNIAENRAILYDLIESNTRTMMLANVTDEFAFKVLDPAVAPEARFRPKRKRMVLTGGVIGLMLGVGLAFFVQYVKDYKEENG